MERYFEGTPPTAEELPRLIQRAVALGSLIPVLCVSAKTGVGLVELLDALAVCAPSADMIARTAQNAAGETVEVKADPAGPLVAQVFKTRIDPFVQKINFLRVYSGTIKKDETVPVAGPAQGTEARPTLRTCRPTRPQPIDDVGPGGIVAVIKLEDLRTGMSLGELTMPPIPFPSPMVGLAVTPKSRGDETKLSGSLNKICQEDSTFRIDRDSQTKEMVATGMSELHLQILRERLKRRDKVEVDTKEPKIPYRETIQINAEGSYRHKKQTGGRGQFGEVHIRMFPLPKDVNIEEWAVKDRFPSLKNYHYDAENNFVWIDSVVGGTIPGNFLPGRLRRASRSGSNAA